MLLTPDEIAYLQPRYGDGEHDPETLPAPQARPNVLFEAGIALGRDASRTVMVEVGDVRPFSDVAGRHAVRLTNSAASRQALAQRLRTAGCDVDLAGLTGTPPEISQRPRRPGMDSHWAAASPPGRGPVRQSTSTSST